MPLSAKKEYADAMRRLLRYTKNSEHSLRELAKMTMGLVPPERMHHTHMSTMLNNKDDRNAYLQQCYVILNLLGLPHLCLLFDIDDAAEAREIQRLVESLADLPRGTRGRVVEEMRAALKPKGRKND